LPSGVHSSPVISEPRPPFVQKHPKGKSCKRNEASFGKHILDIKGTTLTTVHGDTSRSKGKVWEHNGVGKCPK